MLIIKMLTNSEVYTITRSCLLNMKRLMVIQYIEGVNVLFCSQNND